MQHTHTHTLSNPAHTLSSELTDSVIKANPFCMLIDYVTLAHSMTMHVYCFIYTLRH